VQRWRRCRHASKDGHDVDRVPEALWKLYGSPRRPDPTRTRPQIDAETQEPPADTRIGPAVARIRALFASRRSPARSRLAPFVKCLQIARCGTPR
jgi:hypothetical protein